MADVINLRVARKSKQRIAKETVAAQNRTKFGQPKAIKLMEAAQTKLDGTRLDGQKRIKIRSIT